VGRRPVLFGGAPAPLHTGAGSDRQAVALRRPPSPRKLQNKDACRASLPADPEPPRGQDRYRVTSKVDVSPSKPRLGKTSRFTWENNYGNTLPLSSCRGH
jgi:hypothetical protein